MKKILLIILLFLPVISYAQFGQGYNRSENLVSAIVVQTDTIKELTTGHGTVFPHAIKFLADVTFEFGAADEISLSDGTNTFTMNVASDVLYIKDDSGTPVTLLSLTSTGKLTAADTIRSNTGLKVGNPTPADQQDASIILTADFDSDASQITKDQFSITRTANATPISGTWNFSNTQASGFRFNDNVGVNADPASGEAINTSGSIRTNESFMCGHGNGIINKQTDSGRLLFYRGTSLGTDNSYILFNMYDGDLDAASGSEVFVNFNPTVTQTSTAGYTGLLLNVTENSTGSNTNRLFDLQVGSASKFNVENNGDVGVGTTAPVTNSLTLGTKGTQKDIIVTRENTPAGTDSSAKLWVDDGNGKLDLKAGDTDSAIVTCDNDSARLKSNNPWAIQGAAKFWNSITSANYTATNKLTACATNAGGLDFSAASKTLTIADNATIGLDLNALEGLSSTGLVARTAANTFSERTITGTASEIVITNGDGVSGNPTLSLPDDITLGSTSADGSLIIYSEQGANDYTASILANTAMTSNASFYLPANEPGAQSFLSVSTGGVMSYVAPNAGTDITADLEEEVTEGSLADGVIISDDIKSGTIKSNRVDSVGVDGLVTNVTAAANYQPLDADLTALSGLSSTGLVARTAANTFSERIITGTTAEITVTNGDGVSGNPTLSLPDTINLDNSKFLFSPMEDSLYAYKATVETEAYDATSWNGNNTIATKDAIRDKIETLMASTKEVDLVAGAGLSGGANDCMPGSDADVTIAFDATELTAVSWSDGLSGSFAHTYNASAGDDPVFTFNDSSIAITGANMTLESNQVYHAGLTSLEVPVHITDDIAQSFKSEFDIDEQLGSYVHGIKVEHTRTANIQPATGGWFGGQFVLNAGTTAWDDVNKASYAIQGVIKGDQWATGSIDVQCGRFETQSSGTATEMVEILLNTGTSCQNMLALNAHESPSDNMLQLNVQSSATVSKGIEFTIGSGAEITTAIDLESDITGTLGTGIKIGTCTTALDLGGKVITDQEFIWQIDASDNISGNVITANEINPTDANVDFHVSFSKVPSKIFGGTVVLDSIKVYIKTTADNAYVDNILLETDDHDGTGTTRVTYATDIGNGDQTLHFVNILSADYTMLYSQHYWLLIDVAGMVAADEVEFRGAFAYGHLE